jgi:hypothetical protein
VSDVRDFIDKDTTVGVGTGGNLKSDESDFKFHEAHFSWCVIYTGYNAVILPLASPEDPASGSEGLFGHNL